MKSRKNWWKLYYQSSIEDKEYRIKDVKTICKLCCIIIVIVIIIVVAPITRTIKINLHESYIREIRCVINEMNYLFQKKIHCQFSVSCQVVSWESGFLLWTQLFRYDSIMMTDLLQIIRNSLNAVSRRVNNSRFLYPSTVIWNKEDFPISVCIPKTFHYPKLISYSSFFFKPVQCFRDSELSRWT